MDRQNLKSVVPITDTPRGKYVFLKDIPAQYREQFLADTMGQTFEFVDGEPAYFPCDWEGWLQHAALDR